MSITLKRMLMFAIILTVLAGCASATPSPTPIQSLIGPASSSLSTTSNFKPADCPFTVPDYGSNAKPQCGYLTVPEDRSKSGGPTIQLPVAVYGSTTPTTTHNAILFLLSNPGPVLNYSWQLSYALSDMHADYDFVFMEQRGVGLSKPALDCPELTDFATSSFEQDPNSQEVLQQSLDIQTTCHNKLVSSGADLTAYTTATSAADYGDLRQALGYTQWNVYAIGYGSLIAFEMMRNYPQTIHSVMFEATIPPQVDIYAEQGSQTVDSLNLLFQRCNDDADCNKAWPDLKKVFYGLVDQLNGIPITAPATDLNSGKTYQVIVTGDRLISLVLMVLDNSSYQGDLLNHIPRMIYQVKAGKYEELANFLVQSIGYNTPASFGMQSMAYCAEEMGSTTQQNITNAINSIESPLKEYFQRQMQNTLAACAIWKNETANIKKPDKQPVTSDIPALILSGDYSPTTPLAWATLASKTLSRSYLVQFAGAKQVISFFGDWSDCAHQIQKAFLANPTVKPDTSCSLAKVSTLWITLP